MSSCKLWQNMELSAEMSKTSFRKSDVELKSLPSGDHKADVFESLPSGEHKSDAEFKSLPSGDHKTDVFGSLLSWDSVTDGIVPEVRKKNYGDHLSANNNNSKSLGIKKFKMECHHCKKKGHLRRDCPQWKEEKDQLAAVLGGSNPVACNKLVEGVGGSSEMIRQNSVGEIAVVPCTVSEVTEPTFSPEFALKIVTDDSQGERPWWVDSGATQHMNPEKNDFVDYTPFDDPIKVNLADKSYLLAYGSGQIPMRLFDVNQPVDVLLKNVLYVPKIQNK